MKTKKTFYAVIRNPAGNFQLIRAKEKHNGIGKHFDDLDKAKAYRDKANQEDNIKN